ncbi:MAG TPA: CoA-binding protein [Acidimicrobiales bacterium]|nr:CoA-binding protein [Acidimicrobiales bacterium]
MALDDDEVRELLTVARSVAIVPASSNPRMSSHRIGTYLTDAGYEVHPLATLDELADPPDIVYGFVGPGDAPVLAEQAADAGARAVWLHEGIVSPAAERVAERRGVAIVVDRSMEVEHKVLLRGEQRVYFMPM